MRNALGLEPLGMPAVHAKIEDPRREGAQIRTNCDLSEAAIEMRKAAADMRAWTRRRRVVPR